MDHSRPVKSHVGRSSQAHGWRRGFLVFHERAAVRAGWRGLVQQAGSIRCYH